MKPPLLRVRISAAYGSRTVLHDISFDLHAGEALGLIGTSGAGKSTLVLALMGLLPWRGGKVTGEILLDGQNILTTRERDLRKLRGARFALVPQSPLSALNPAISLRAHFEEAWKAHQTTGRGALNWRLQALLPEVQLTTDPAFLSRKPGEISVGQAQRVVIALSMLHRPALLIADEPTSALDPVTQTEIIALLRRLNRTSGTTLLYISHDLLSVLQLCGKVAILDAGTLAEHLPTTDLEQRSKHPATLALLRALPVPPSVLLGWREQNRAAV